MQNLITMSPFHYDIWSYHRRKEQKNDTDHNLPLSVVRCLWGFAFRVYRTPKDCFKLKWNPKRVLCCIYVLQFFFFVSVFLFQTSDSSHWWFSRANQNMATERRLDKPVSPRGGILSCHSEWRADRITSNILYTCLLRRYKRNSRERSCVGKYQRRSRLAWLRAITCSTCARKFSFLSRHFGREKKVW